MALRCLILIVIVVDKFIVSSSADNQTQNCIQYEKPVVCPMTADGGGCSNECGCGCREVYQTSEDEPSDPGDQSDQYTCGENEVLDSCPADCPSDYCPETVEDNESCPAPDPCPPPACKCKFDYRRDENGTCIPSRDCPNLCPVNEEYSSCTPAVCRPQNCSQRNDPPMYCPAMDTDSCNLSGCVCKQNYYRNENGTCITADQCENQTVCGENEFLDNCPADCPSDYCPKSEEDNETCPAPDPCPPPACKCDINFRRTDNGSCIPTEDCPPFNCSARPNEQYTACPPDCPSDNCSLARVKGECPYNIDILLICNPKCQCQDGYGRSNGTCVPFEECPNLCPEKEEYNSCIQRTCRPPKCSNRNNAVFECRTVDDDDCEKGCVCNQNYYRNDNGTCVTSDQCEDVPKNT